MTDYPSVAANAGQPGLSISECVRGPPARACRRTSTPDGVRP